MAFDVVLERFSQESPVSVMARLALQRAISPEWMDSLFEQHRERQYTRELLFSTVVELMGVVAMGLRLSLHAAAKASEVGDSMAVLYEKVNGTEPALVRALVQGSAQRLGPVVQPMKKAEEPWAEGYRVRVVDGNHLPASQKRLKPLRGFRGAALRGHCPGPALQALPQAAPSGCPRSLPPHAPGPHQRWLLDRNERGPEGLHRVRVQLRLQGGVLSAGLPAGAPHHLESHGVPRRWVGPRGWRGDPEEEHPGACNPRTRRCLMMRSWIAAVAVMGAVLTGCGGTGADVEAEPVGEDSSALVLCQIGDPSCQTKQGTACSMSGAQSYCCDAYGGGRQTCTCIKSVGYWVCPQ